MTWLSCGGSASGAHTSGLKYRAFVTNSVSSNTGGAGIDIVDASQDVRPIIQPISAGNTPGMMVLTPDRTETLVFSGNGTPSSDNLFSIINNASEANAFHLTLPGMTESFVVSPDSSVVYVAVPTAPVVGQSPGVIQAINLVSGNITATISCPPLNPNPPNPPLPPVCVTQGLGDEGFNMAYRFLSISNTGDRLLAFGDDSDTIAVITPSNVGTTNPVVTFVPGFDRPVSAFFSSDDATVYVVNCGAECGGGQASVQQFNLTDDTLGSYVAVCAPGTAQCAGSVALVDGATMYLAGTPYSAGGPSQLCAAGTTQATFCGLLTTVDLSSMTVTNTAPILITDGYHDRIALGANGQLFIGARTCTEITGTETRGCLSIYNSQTGAVVIPPASGDVTGIQPISKRTVVYVVQGGTLDIYDATTDVLYNNPKDPNNPGQIMNLIGQFVDVKTVDF